jgi:CrcB protein
MFLELVYVGIGGFFGAVARAFSYKFIKIAFPETLFPYGTLFVNLSGCLIIGFLVYIIEKYGFLENQFRFFVITGFLGAFTTFSTFGYDNFKLIQNGNHIASFANISISIVAGVGLVFIGNILAKLIFS